MCDLMPNCVITVYFHPGPKPSFSYLCTNSSRGWEVQPNGSIHPPSRSRIVQYRLSSPNIPGDIVNFAAFQLTATEPTHPDPANDPPIWTSPSELGQLGVEIVTPTPYPPTGSIAGPLTLQFGLPPKPPSGLPPSELPPQPPPRLYYRLAVNLNGGPEAIWDDPKIYDDGSL